jgi:hypothetical protein
MNKRNLQLSLLVFLVAFVAGFWMGCSVEFDANEDETYFCQSNADCLDPLFLCDTGRNVCKKISVDQNNRPRVDADGDGYGVGEDRSGCRFPQEDCDDTNPNVNPGANEVCDGIDNNCDGNVDVTSCNRDGDCPRNQKDSQGNDVAYSCSSGQCVAKPVIQVCFDPKPACPECNQVLQCRNGVLDVVAETCR